MLYYNIINMFGSSSRFDKSLNGVKVLSDGIITIKNGVISNVNSIDANNINNIENNVNDNTNSISLINDSLTNITDDINDLNSNLFNNYYDKVTSDARYPSTFQFNNLVDDVNDVKNDLTNANNNLINNYYDKISSDARYPSIFQYNNLVDTTTTNTNNITTINSNINTINSQINTINNSSIPNLQTQINNINNALPELDDIHAGSFNNALQTTITNNVMVATDTLSDAFFQINMDRNSNRQFNLSIPIALYCQFNSALFLNIQNFRMTNLIIRVLKNGNLFNNYTAEVMNTPYDTSRGMSNTQANQNAGAIGRQYYGNYRIMFIPDFITSGNDIYTFHAIASLTADNFGNINLVPRALINTNISDTQSTPGNAGLNPTYANASTPGFESLFIRRQLPVSKPNTYLAGGLINYFPILEIIMPINYIYISTSADNPRWILGGFGIWEPINDRILRGANFGENLGTTTQIQANIVSPSTIFSTYNVLMWRRIG